MGPFAFSDYTKPQRVMLAQRQTNSPRTARRGQNQTQAHAPQRQHHREVMRALGNTKCRTPSHIHTEQNESGPLPHTIWKNQCEVGKTV